jgi:hypothetical protein
VACRLNTPTVFLLSQSSCGSVVLVLMPFQF